MSAGRILLVEDDPKIARIVERGLVLKDLEVVVAEDGLTGRDLWSKGGFDLVLLDVMLPGMNGIDLCSERRATGDTTPVILLTARGEEEIQERGVAAGVTDYISKPFAYADLLERVFQLLRRQG
jgi:DNA-binding response OmpR family regulator